VGTAGLDLLRLQSLFADERLVVVGLLGQIVVQYTVGNALLTGYIRSAIFSMIRTAWARRVYLNSYSCSYTRLRTCTVTTAQAIVTAKCKQRFMNTSRT